MNRTKIACLVTAILTLTISSLLTTTRSGTAMAADSAVSPLKIRNLKFRDSSLGNVVIPKDWRLVSTATEMTHNPSETVLWFSDTSGNIYQMHGYGQFADLEIDREVQMISVER